MHLVAARGRAAGAVEAATQTAACGNRVTGAQRASGTPSARAEGGAVEGVDACAGLTLGSFDDQPEDDDEITAGQLTFLDVARQPPGQLDLVAMAELRGLRWSWVAGCAHRHLSTFLDRPRVAAGAPRIGRAVTVQDPGSGSVDGTGRAEAAVDGPAGIAEPADLGHDVFAIDTAMGGHERIVASYLLRTPRPCLVETGAASSVDTVRAAVERLGVGADDLATILVTHIHLDHAGGVGDIARAFPRAEVVVHELGARHLVDPTRLLASAGRVYGDVLQRLFGLLAPTDAARVRAVAAEGEVDLGGGRVLALHHAPGHAQHHLGIFDSATGDLYVGDAAGVWVPEVAVLKPATPPPDFDLALCLRTLERFRQMRPTRLLFSHFGPVDDVEPILEESAAQLHLWTETVRASRRTTPALDHAVAAVRERTRERYAALYADPAIAQRVAVLNTDEANVAGIMRWCDRQDVADGS